MVQVVNTFLLLNIRRGFDVSPASDRGQHRIMNNKRKYPSYMIHDNGAASKVPSCKSFDLILGYHLLRIHVAVEISGEDINWIIAEIATRLIVHPS